MLSVIALATAVSCGGFNQSGNLGATKTGDTSHPATRGSPVDELHAACGSSGEMTADGSVIHRQPYLQQVTTESAMIGWVTTSPDGEHLDVTTVAGLPVMSAVATVQEGNQRSAGEKQMWATISGLQPDTVYCYSLANGTKLSDRIGFRTAPTADSTRPIRILAFGDSGGGGADQLALRDQMFKFPYELIIHTGDIAYDDGTIGQFEDNVFGVYSDLFKSIPFMPAAGNHEYKTLRGAPFRDVFALPGDSGEKWYSYDWGRIHFAVLDTESDYRTQAEWLDQDLATSQAPWKIVYMHRPPYSSGDHGSDLALRNVLAPVLESHHVQLLLAGHDHDYERMVPQNGVEYVVTGGGGRGTYNVGTSSFTAFSDEVIHFVTLEVGVDELTLHAIDANGNEFDSAVVPRA
ncbi:MAG TPA: metallophosphoesterase family protein [Kofleriaceae bacterium]|nr:metallophosphoesterase family protein [Kofleriaceae bacterium]